MVTWASADVTARRHVVRFSKIFFSFFVNIFAPGESRTLKMDAKMVTWASADVTARRHVVRFSKFFFRFCQYLRPWKGRTLKMVTWASADVTARRHVVRFSKIFFRFSSISSLLEEVGR
ncbi:hypothetical protein PUN28_002205 [Cardiocondyla obscurior]|uniref:Secreted protein n=1 Tax=Cardiocondyla obscurior TaxID=286306 RepID=A0AAW2GT60_9HYME